MRINPFFFSTLSAILVLITRFWEKLSYKIYETRSLDVISAGTFATSLTGLYWLVVLVYALYYTLQTVYVSSFAL